MLEVAYAQQGEWRIQDREYSSYYFGEVDCTDSATCFVIASDGVNSIVRRTLDAGVTWHTVWLDTVAMNGGNLNRPRQVVSVSGAGNTCVVTLDSSHFAVSRDGGYEWEVLRLNDGVLPLYSVATRDDGRGVIIERPNGVWVTDDDWRSWRRLDLPRVYQDSLYCFAVAMPSATTIVLLGTRYGTHNDRIIVRTDDGGDSWSEYAAPSEITGQFLYDDRTGWVYGARSVPGADPRNVIEKTTDGGRSWFVQIDSVILPSGSIIDMDSYDGVHVLATGMQGKILRSTDGGEHWSQETADFPPNVQTESFVAYPAADVAIISSLRAGRLRWWPTPSVVMAAEQFRSLRLAVNPVVKGANIEIVIPWSCDAGSIHLVSMHGENIRTNARMLPSGHGTRGVISTVNVPYGNYVVAIKCGNRTDVLPATVH